MPEFRIVFDDSYRNGPLFVAFRIHAVTPPEGLLDHRDWKNIGARAPPISDHSPGSSSVLEITPRPLGLWQRQPETNGSPFPRSAAHLELPPNLGHPCGHILQAVPLLIRNLWSETQAIIGHFDSHHTSFGLHMQSDFAGLGVLGGVVHRLFDDQQNIMPGFSGKLDLRQFGRYTQPAADIPGFQKLLDEVAKISG